MIKLKSHFSNRIIKKGDEFTIYIDITNGNNKPVVVKDVTISQPMGFNPLTELEQEQANLSIWKKARIFFAYFLYITGWGGLPRRQIAPSDTHSDTRVVGASIIRKVEKNEGTIQPNANHSERFYLKAGWSGGLRPRPDTYTIQCDVKYVLDSLIYHENIDIDVSIFPSIGSMLVGTLVGGLLGTLVKELLSKANLLADFTTLGIVGTLGPILPILFSNLILGFIVAVVLMRKKDVQPFLTIEDFWGGILVGFLTSYTSSQLLEQFSNIKIINTP